MRGGYKEQRDNSNHQEKKAAVTIGKKENSSHQGASLMPETEPVPLAQPEQIPAGITVLEESGPQEKSVQLKSQEPPAGLTVLEQSWAEEEMMDMPALEETVDFRVPKFLQKQLDDVYTDDETASEKQNDENQKEPFQDKQMSVKEESSHSVAFQRECEPAAENFLEEAEPEAKNILEELEEPKIEQETMAEADVSSPVGFQEESKTITERVEPEKKRNGIFTRKHSEKEVIKN